MAPTLVELVPAVTSAMPSRGAMPWWLETLVEVLRPGTNERTVAPGGDRRQPPSPAADPESRVRVDGGWGCAKRSAREEVLAPHGGIAL